MIRVIHFDYNKFDSGAIRDGLDFEFKKHPDVQYTDFMQDHPGGTDSLKTLECLLPENDVLLIHPGVERQNIVLTYSQQFPNLRVALVIPGDFSHYHHEEIFDTPLFGYQNIHEIVRFVLQREEF